MGKPAEVKKGRFEAVDALRGMAVLLMVFNHGLEWTYAGGGAHKIITVFGSLTLGDIATPMFYLAAGLSLHFSLQSNLRKSGDPAALRRKYATRLGKLFIIGIAISLSWGVLQAQAASLFVLACLTLSMAGGKNTKLTRYILPGIIALTLTAHLLITRYSLPALWENIFAGQFPFFAILTINVTGFFLAPLLRSKTFSLKSAGLGVLLIGTALYLGNNLFDLRRYGASISFLLLGIGLSILLLGIFHFNLLQRLAVFRHLALVGKDSLFLYLFHFAIFLVPIYFSGLMENMSMSQALIFTTSMTASVIITARLRQRSKLTIYSLFDAVLLAFWVYLLAPLTQTLQLLLPRPTPYINKAGLWTDR